MYFSPWSENHPSYSDHISFLYIDWVEATLLFRLYSVIVSTISVSTSFLVFCGYPEGLCGFTLVRFHASSEHRFGRELCVHCPEVTNKLPGNRVASWYRIIFVFTLLFEGYEILPQDNNISNHSPPPSSLHIMLYFLTYPPESKCQYFGGLPILKTKSKLWINGCWPWSKKYRWSPNL